MKKQFVLIATLLMLAANCINGKGKWEKGKQNIYVINATGKEIMLAYSIPEKTKGWVGIPVNGTFVGKLNPSEGVWLHPPLGKKISKLIWTFTANPDQKVRYEYSTKTFELDKKRKGKKLFFGSTDRRSAKRKRSRKEVSAVIGDSKPLNMRYVYSAGHHFAHLNPNTSSTREIRIHPKSNKGGNKENPGLEQTIPKKIGKWGGSWPADKNIKFAAETDRILSLLNAGNEKGLYETYYFHIKYPGYIKITRNWAIDQFLWKKIMEEKILKKFPNIGQKAHEWFSDQDYW